MRHLYTDNSLVLLEKRLSFPSLNMCLLCLHSTHQSEVGMKSHANESVYWPGMYASIHNVRANCMVSLNITTSQPWEPITLTPSPDRLFQLIVMDLFYDGDT